MSGINSLIDTVLHQVLGKRVDTAAPRELNVPVRPVSPSDAPRALHSDSRLDARARNPQVAEPAQARPDPRSAPSPRSGGDGAAVSSTQTHFTQGARSIADVLMRFPAPPSVLQLAAPLVPAGETLGPGQVAERLQSSVRDSGLFYEAHLSRWYRGELPREQLLREPQNWRPAQAPGARAEAAGAPPAEGREAPQPAAGRETAIATPRDPVQESLQGIVRQQLEMLVAPVLRWEGDVWTGLFMALVLQLPVAEREGKGEGDADDAREEQSGYRAAMTLEVAGFGAVRVAIWLSDTRLDVTLSAPDPSVHATLEDGVSRLTSRLEELSLGEVSVRVLEVALDGRA